MLLRLSDFEKVFIYRPFTDFRRGINGLSIIVQEEMMLNPFKKYLFLFCNRHRNGIKILYWDNCGFSLLYKRLEKDKFKWPSHLREDTFSVDTKKIEDFLEGLNPWQMPFKKINYQKI